MDPITLIVTALAAGATAGGLDTAKDGAKAGATAACAKLRGLVQKRVAGNQGAEGALSEIGADPETWKAPLAKNNVTITNSQGVQFGEGNVPFNNFGA